MESKTINSDICELPAVGEYHILSVGPSYPVAITTLGNTKLADRIFELKPKGLSIVGKTETENIGLEKIIKNVLALPSIKYLILCGKDSEGHYSGSTLVCLTKNGVDPNMRVIESKGKKPVLLNITKEEVNAFRNQIEIINMIECEDIDKVLERVHQLSRKTESQCSHSVTLTLNLANKKTTSIEVIEAEGKDPDSVKLDKAGYFVIVPKVESNIIFVEHYNYANQLLRILKGNDSREIYWTIIENSWVTELSHAAYLGKELAKAEMSMRLGFKYIQDKA